jgi:hypothetical protein
VRRIGRRSEEQPVESGSGRGVRSQNQMSVVDGIERSTKEANSGRSLAHARCFSTQIDALEALV